MTPPPVLPGGSDLAEHPDVPDEQGRVWCTRCLRRVTPAERRGRRGAWEGIVELSDEELEALRPRRPESGDWWDGRGF